MPWLTPDEHTRRVEEARDIALRRLDRCAAPLAEALPTVRQVSSAVSSAAGCFTTIKMILLIMVVLVLLFFVAVCVLAFIRVASEDSATGASLRAAAALWGQLSG